MKLLAKQLWAVVALSSAMVLPAPAAVTIASYSFGTTTPGSLASSDVESLSSASSISKGTGLGASSTAVSTAGNPAWSFMFAKADLGTSFNASNYISFVVSMSVAGSMNLNGATLNFDVAAGAAGKSVSWSVRNSIAGFGADNATGSTTGTTFAAIPTISLTGSQYGSVTNIEFRIYGWQTGPGNNTDIYFDNIQLSATSVVPEPATIAMAIFAAAFAVFHGARLVRARLASA